MKTQRLFDTARSCGCEILMNEPLCGHTTFKIGGNCTALIEVNSTESLRKLLDAARADSVRTFVLGKGSNVLFADEGFDGVVLHIASEMSEVRLLGETAVFAQAGCSMMKLCRFALENSLTGLEFAYGIPGTVGGAVFMNAGAYGGEIKDVIKYGRAVDKEGRQFEFNAEQMRLGYRTSRFAEEDELIVEGEFELPTGSYDDIQDKMVELMSRRREKQPLDMPSAGSAFKRPEGNYAGKLIQDSGLRGFSVGGAQVSEKHCGFIVNKGGATCENVLELIDHIQQKVKADSGIMLECEVRYIPYE